MAAQTVTLCAARPALPSVRAGRRSFAGVRLAQQQQVRPVVGPS